MRREDIECGGKVREFEENDICEAVPVILGGENRSIKREEG